MARRMALLLLFALLLASLFSYVLNYFQLISIGQLPFFQSGVGLDRSRELAIRLHPEEHVGRKPRINHLRWEVTRGYRSPDGVQKLVYLINGVFPGPTLEATSGDTMIIEVTNRVENEGISFHWHGLHMKGANEMDGVVGVTQDAIAPGATFIYKFQIEDTQAGTFWYHSHSELQRADGLFGGLVIHAPLDSDVSEAGKHNYREEILLLIGDWYHRPADEVQASYVTHDSWGREPVPDSLLINGLGAFNCSMAVPSRPLLCGEVATLALSRRTRRTRLRIVNVGSMSGFSLMLPDHEMDIFQVDGGNDVDSTGPVSSAGILYPGERIDMVVESSFPTSHLTIILDDENYTIRNKALAATQSFSILSPPKVRRGHSSRPSSATDTLGIFDISKVNGTALPPNSVPVLADQTVLIYTKMEVLAHLGNVPAGFINRTTWIPQNFPLLELKKSQWDTHQLVPWISISRDTSKEKWVDIVINNLDEKGHPFHLHGYDFYLIKYYKPSRRGYHAYNPFSPLTPPSSPGFHNLQNPMKKDTVYVPGQGYVVLRIKADNLGIWFFHCHILWHSGAGMAMGLQVGYE